ncbi:hypothetical protein ACFSUS_00495 [Spirosoma soli]|uniref:Uncharacterized protein n=1 Tax=Spirosoma soli TaxID=1770529 RepID=A0ABW5LXW1_9BACT
MTVQQAAIELAVQQIGFKSVYDFAAQKLRDSLLEEIKVSLDAIDVFERKYGMNYEQFKNQFFSLKTFDLFEREDDSMDWSAEIAQLRILEKRLAQLLPSNAAS